MRKLLLWLFATVLAVVFVPLAAQADDGFEYSAFYDFEEYSADVGSGIEPDSNWGNVISFGNEKKDDYGSYYDGPEHGMVMKVTNGGEPNLFFGQIMNTGKLHISADIKIIGKSMQVLFIGYDGRNTDDAQTVDNVEYYSKMIRLRSSDNVVGYYSGNLTGWNSVERNDMNYVPEEWHRVDIVTTNLSGSSPTIQYYLDGQLINSDTITMSSSKGLKSIGIRGEVVSGQTSAAEDCVLMDNLKVDRYFGEMSLTASALSEPVALQDGTLDVKLSENVDPSLLVKENVQITHVASGSFINNYTIESVSGNGFTVQFSGDIEAGRYNLILKNSVVGNIFENPMSVPLTFRTEEASKIVTTQVADIDFNDYTAAEEKLPLGFGNLEGASYTPRSLPGADGSDSDRAFGFENASTARTATRFMYQFDTPIQRGAQFDVEFDVYAQNAYWYLYLGEEDDFDANNPDYNKNAAIATVNNAGLIRYAKSRSSSVSDDIDSALSAAPGQWNHIKLSVIPNDSGSVYKVSVNGGTEYEVTALRKFDDGVYGFGLGYIAVSAESEVRFDNVKIESTMKIVYPMVNDVKIYAYDGSEVVPTKVATSLITHAVFEYNTLVDEESAKAHTVLCDGSGGVVDCEYSFETIDDKTYLTLRFPDLLSPDEQYTLKAESGVTSGFAADVASTESFSVSFTTENAADFKLFGEKLDTENGQYTVSFAKNSDAQGKFYVAVCAVETVVRNINGTEMDVEQLKDIRYIPIDIKSEDKGIFTYSFDAPFITEGSNIKTYIWNWPSLKKVVVDRLGSIQQ